MANNNLETTEKESKQYIVVMVGSEQYGIDISYIDNIVRMQKITRVPKVQTYFKAGRKGRDRCDCRRGEGSRQFK